MEEDKHAIILRQNLPRLVNCLRATDEICDILVQNSLITIAEKEEIESKKTTTNKNRSMVRMLMARSAATYQTFLNALDITHQSDLKSALTGVIQSKSHDLTASHYELIGANHCHGQQYEELHTERLRKYLPTLVDDLKSVEEICDTLVAEFQITDGERQQILCQKTRHNQNRKLIYSLVRRSVFTYEAFLKALVATKQNQLKDLLLGAESTGSEATTPNSSTSELDDHGQHFIPVTEDFVKETLSKSISSQDYFESYELTHDPRGLALIVNVSKFRNSQEYEAREGSLKDVEDLSLMFKQLYFDVRRPKQEDPTVQDIQSFLLEEKRRITPEHDMLVLVLMSHGEKDVIYGSDQNPIEINFIKDLFNTKNCPQLRNKPKFFLIQSCRQYNKTWNPPAGIQERCLHVDVPVVNFPPTPVSACGNNIADFFIAWATPEGYVAYRYKTGSVFIQTFISVMYRHAHNRHLTDIMTRVNNELRYVYITTKVDVGKTEIIKQISWFEGSCGKYIYFFPEYPARTAEI